MITRAFAVLVVLATSFAPASAEDDPYDSGSGSAGGVTVDVLGQSGKMTLTNEDDESVTIEMDSLYELNAAGEIIGNTGPNSDKHSRQTFANTDFVIDPENRTSFDGVECDAIDFSTSLVGGTASLGVTTLVFLDNGTITPTPNETHHVQDGTVKFSIGVESWPFCAGESGNPCKGEIGEYLELNIAIKGLDGADPTPTSHQNSFALGNSSAGGFVTLELSDVVRIDGVWTPMPSGYPKVTTQGSKQVFQFRLPKFTTEALYDPLVAGLYQKQEPPSPPPSTTQKAFMSGGVIAGMAVGAIVLVFGGYGWFKDYCKTDNPVKQLDGVHHSVEVRQ